MATFKSVFRDAAAAARQRAAEEFIRSFPAGSELVVVAPARPAADDFVRRVVASSGGTFGLHRFSLTQLASKLSRQKLASDHVVPVTHLAAEALAAHTAYVVRSEDGLRYFEPVAGYPGFSRSVAATLTELRLAGARADEVKVGDSGFDIAKLLQRFNDGLSEHALSDIAHLFEAATDAVASANDRVLVTAPLLLLDLQLRSAAEEKFVAALSLLRERALATVIVGDDRSYFFFLRNGFSDVARLNAQKTDTSLDRLRESVFAVSNLKTSSVDETVTFFSAPGEAREAIEIARRIYDEARRGVAFDDVAVLAREPSQYLSHLEAAFRRANIPFYVAPGATRPDPSGRAFLSLLACVAEDFSARRFAEYVSLAQVPRGAPPQGDGWVPPKDDVLYPSVANNIEDDGDEVDAADEPDAEPLRAPWRWEELLVEAAVIGGADRWERRLRGLGEQFIMHRDRLQRDDPDSPRIEALDRDLKNLRELAAFAVPLIRRLEDLRACATWGDWLKELREIAGLTLRKPARVLQILAELDPMAAVGPVTIKDAQAVLADRLSRVPRRQPHHRFGRVFIGAIDHARGRQFRVVFVPGLSERSFPKQPREDPMLLDRIRVQIPSRLRVQAERIEDERLLLRVAIGAASERIIFSYPRVDISQARVRVPSFYALDIARTIYGYLPPPDVLERDAAGVTQARLAWPAPRNPAIAIDAAEHDLAVLLPLLREAEPTAVVGRAQYLLQLNPTLGRSLRARRARWVVQRWNAADGLVAVSAEVAKLLGEYRLSSHAYSVSGLERYARCPYQFFLASIQHLKARETIEPIERLDPMTRGTLVHELYARVLAEFRRTSLFPLTGDRLSAAQAIADRLINEIAGAYHDRLAPAIERVWRDEIQSIRSDTYLWLRSLAADGTAWMPRYFELSFGLVPPNEHEPASVREEVVLDGEGWRVRGSIDLIEEATNGQSVRVTDYKTGRDDGRGNLVVGQGEKLQPLVYARVAEAVLRRSVSGARLFFATSRGGFASRTVQLTDWNRKRLDVVLREIDEAIATPRLLPIPREHACESCDFLQICGPYEWRRSREQKDPNLRAHVEALREMT